MGLPLSISQLDFEQLYKPWLESRGISLAYVTSKAYNPKTNQVSFYERELKKDVTAILINGCVYQFILKEYELFNSSTGNTKSWRGEADKTNFAAFNLADVLPAPNAHTSKGMHTITHIAPLNSTSLYSSIPSTQNNKQILLPNGFTELENLLLNQYNVVGEITPVGLQEMLDSDELVDQHLQQINVRQQVISLLAARKQWLRSAA